MSVCIDGLTMNVQRIPDGCLITCWIVLIVSWVLVTTNLEYATVLFTGTDTSSVCVTCPMCAIDKCHMVTRPVVVALVLHCDSAKDGVAKSQTFGMRRLLSTQPFLDKEFTVMLVALRDCPLAQWYFVLNMLTYSRYNVSIR